MNVSIRSCALLLALAWGCAAELPAEPSPENQRSAAVTPRGARVLAMDIGPGPGETREQGVAKARSAGITTAVLNYNWSELEPSAFQYQNARLIADNTFYSTAPHDVSVVLNLRPMAGMCRVVPSDLVGVAWNDPVMITRFSYLLIWIHGHLPGVKVNLMSIGTEIDSHLAPADYAAYKVFFDAARANVKALWGQQLPVGTTATWGTLTTPGPEQTALLDLNEHADHVFTTYYAMNPTLTAKDPFWGPIGDVYAAIAAVEGNPKTAGKVIDFIEVGYASAAALGSSDAHQQVFVSTMFALWDAWMPKIGALVFTWQNDLSLQDAQLVSIGSWGGGGCEAPVGSPPAAPATTAVTARGTTGGATWSYYVVAVGPAGNSLPGPTATTSSGAATLSATAYNRISWSAVPGATSYKVLRRASGGAPAATGLIATTTATTVDDTGLASSTYAFQEYIRTLGYRTNAQPIVDKPGFVQLGTEAHARGW